MKNMQTILAVVFLVVLSSICIQNVFAEDSFVLNKTDISNNALSGATGVIGVNMAAGDDNAQVNARAIVIGGGQLAFSGLNIHQRINNRLTLESNSYHLDYIGGDAFAGSRGLVSINQAAGSSSAQANLVSIGIGANAGPLGLGVGVSLASSEQLLMSYGASDTGQGYEVRRSDIIDGNAFSGSHGLVQVNQSAGSANRVFNAVAIQFKEINIP